MREKIYFIYTIFLILLSFVIFFNGILMIKPNVVHNENIGLMCPYIRQPRKNNPKLEIVPQQSPAGRANINKDDLLISVAGLKCTPQFRNRILSKLNQYQGKIAVGKHIPVKIKRGEYVIDRKIYLTKWKTWNDVWNLCTISTILAFLTGTILLYIISYIYMKRKK